MPTFRKGISRRRLGVSAAVAVAGVAALSLGTTAGSADPSTAAAPAAGSAEVAVLLPDTKSSARWETADRPYLAAAFKRAGLSYSIVNAEGSKTTQIQQAETAITNGAKVILLVDLDSVTGAAIETKAVAQGVKVIDYDRLTLKGKATYYVSFDNVGVGKLQGEGLAACIKSKGLKNPVVAELNGSPTDNNATLFARGYNSILNPLYKKGTYTKGPNQSVPDWDNQKALQIFEQMLAAKNNKINAVAAANDGLANAVISALKQRHLPMIPVTGQDATDQGLQHILAGEQCMTVYKAVKKEADAASALAISLIKGGKPTGINGKSFDLKRQVPSVLLKPVAVTKKNIGSTVIKDKYTTWAKICVGAYKKYCPKH
jgi:D-xylose transport system substrate-binding protein